MNNSIINWFVSNKEWVFSGIGASILGIIAAIFMKDSKSEVHQEQQVSQNNNQNVVVNVHPQTLIETRPLADRADNIKNITRILFIDDDKKFNIVKIIKEAGWQNTKMIQDVCNLDEQIIRDTDIFFVDINGVGVKLKFPDEGLGLAKALKEKYSDKKIIIYSAENQSLHPALNEMDWILKKDATPYEFLHVIEKFSIK